MQFHAHEDSRCIIGTQRLQYGQGEPSALHCPAGRNKASGAGAGSNLRIQRPCGLLQTQQLHACTLSFRMSLAVVFTQHDFDSNFVGGLRNATYDWFLPGGFRALSQKLQQRTPSPFNCTFLFVFSCVITQTFLEKDIPCRTA